MQSVRPPFLVGLATILALLGARDGTLRTARAHGIEFKACGEVLEVSAAALPAAITVLTFTGPVTIQAAGETRFRVDDGESVGGGEPGASHEGEDHGDEEPGAGEFREDLGRLVGRFAAITYERGSGVAELVQVERRFEVFGRVGRINGEHFTLTTPGGAAVPLSVDGESRVELDGQPAELASLSGLLVRCRFDPATRAAAVLAASSGRRLFRGRLTAIDLPGGRLTFGTGRSLRVARLSEETDLNLDFEDATITDLAVGGDVWCDGIEEPRRRPGAAAPPPPLPVVTAYRVDAGTAREEAVAGTLLSVSGLSRTLAVTWRRGGAAVTRPFKVNGGTRILLNGRSVTLDDLKPGRRVEVRYVLRHGLAVVRRLVVGRAP